MDLKYNFWEYFTPTLANAAYALILLLDASWNIKVITAFIMVISNLAILVRYTDINNAKDLKIYQLIDLIAAENIEENFDKLKGNE